MRLVSAIPEEATVARLAGDSFALLLPSGNPLDLHAASDAVNAALHRPFEVDGQVVQLSASIGMAVAPGHGEDAEELLVVQI